MTKVVQEGVPLKPHMQSIYKCPWWHTVVQTQAHGKLRSDLLVGEDAVLC